MATLDQQLQASIQLHDSAKEETMTTAIEKVDPQATPMAMLQMAVAQGADIDKLTKLMELQERWEANEARKAFNAAMAKFKDNPPKILKNKHVRYQTQKGVTEYDHSTLDHVCDQITASLSRVGITHKWIPKQKDGKISVTCLLTHELGYRDPDPPTLEASPDESGSKNSIQGIGSTVTYLERYTLLAAVGMASGMDDDGRGNKEEASKGLEQDEYDRMMGLIEMADSLPLLQKTFAECFKIARSANDQSAMAAFTKAKDKRKADLQ